MDSPFMTLTLALIVGISALIVDAQQNVRSSPPRPPQLSPPPPFSPPPPPRPSRRHLSPPPRGNVGHRRSSPPPTKENLNTGKKVGLVFIGVGVILQVCVVAFLLITRRRLLKGENAQ